MGDPDGAASGTSPVPGSPAPGSPAYRAAQRADLLRFAAGARDPLGFGWLDERGAPDPGRPVELWITCRMTHVLALGVLRDEAPAPGGPDVEALRELAGHGVRSLLGPLADLQHGGWFASVARGRPADGAKQAYGHAFVVLAAGTAVAAGLPGAAALLERALAVQDERFWDAGTGLVREEWDRGWKRLSPYRGLNAAMHTVEAYLAASDVTGDRRWRDRAAGIAERVRGWARESCWRVPEHFDEHWTPQPGFGREHPDDPFRPYGATVGHGLEWARLLVSLDAALGAGAPKGLVEDAVSLADRAVADGWAADGADGFVYTTDWDGAPVVRTRMHWVAAEAVATAYVLHRATGEARWADEGRRWWRYVEDHLVDHSRGSWHHELDAGNRPAATVWAGKPDVYHAYQAALLPELPPAGSVVGGVLAAR